MPQIAEMPRAGEAGRIEASHLARSVETIKKQGDSSISKSPAKGGSVGRSRRAGAGRRHGIDTDFAPPQSSQRARPASW
jgi:hypothetical protein